ncbi:MAG: SRPBCC domain-containing protein [bacterium]
MKKVLLILGGFVAIVGLVAVIGAVLPKEHTATQAAQFKQAPPEIWNAITDFGAMAAWNSSFDEVKPLPDHNGNAAWSLISDQGPMPLEVVEMDTNKKLVTRIIDEGMPFGGTWTYELAETEGGTLLTITEDGFVRNVIFRFMARFIFGYHSTLERFLEDLGKKFDEKVAVVEQPDEVIANSQRNFHGE